MDSSLRKTLADILKPSVWKVLAAFISFVLINWHRDYHNSKLKRGTVSITPVQTEKDLKTTATLFQAYAESLGIDLAFQGFAAELASLPGKYASPGGALYLAHRKFDGQAIGCVGLRSSPEHGVCEMKRLYVSPNGRGLGVGRQLAEGVISEARRLGYEAMLLDTLPHMVSAIELYKSLGFVEVGPYYETPLEGTVFLRLDLKTIPQPGPENQP